MSDPLSDLSEREIAELSALADGSLPAQRRAEVEARVAASPELLELVERQRQTVTATQALAADAPPASLVGAVEALRSGPAARRSRTRMVPRLALAGGLAVVAAIVAAVVLSGGPGGPTVADAARLASTTPAGPPPPPLANSPSKLALDIDGVVFPNLTSWAGWHATGVRHGRIDGRAATVVFYGKDGRRIGYVIVAGSPLHRPAGAQQTTTGGVRYDVFRLNGRLAITWRRGGRTCVAIGDATRPELLRLASWRLTG